MTHPSDLGLVVAAIWARRGPQVLVDVEALCNEVNDSPLPDPRFLAKRCEKVHELIGVFGIMQFADCIELCRSIQAILDDLKSHSSNQDLLAALAKLTQELREAVAKQLSAG
jgi:hypothetical protein